MKTRWLSHFTIAAMIAAVGCKGANKPAADASLQTDLSLAAQQRAASESLSALELSRTGVPAASRIAPGGPAGTTRRTTSVSRTSSSGGTVVRSSSGEVVQKNTRRDAAIGAAAGAVIGATTSRNKVKGGVIGGVVGGIIGGVIGNNVDVKKKPGGG
jgi:hypothetical protein